VLKARRDAVNDIDHCIAIGNCQRAAGTEVVLHVDDQSTSWELISISSPLLLSQLYPTMAFPGSLCGRLKRSLFDAVHMGKARDGALFKVLFLLKTTKRAAFLRRKPGISGFLFTDKYTGVIT